MVIGSEKYLVFLDLFSYELYYSIFIGDYETWKMWVGGKYKVAYRTNLWFWHGLSPVDKVNLFSKIDETVLYGLNTIRPLLPY